MLGLSEGILLGKRKACFLLDIHEPRNELDMVPMKDYNLFCLEECCLVWVKEFCLEKGRLAFC